MNKRTEQRRHQRIDMHVPVKYSKLKDGSGVKGDGSITSDLSLGGVRFRTEKFIPMANRLILELEIPERSKPVKAISKIAWIRKTNSGKDYEAGNQFLEMSKEDKDSIAEYVKDSDKCSGLDVNADE